MATIDFADLTIPTPAPYDDTDPSKQKENLCYVLLQLIQLFKSAGLELSFDETSPMPINLVEAVQNLIYDNITFDWGAGKIILDGRSVSIEEG